MSSHPSQLLATCKLRKLLHHLELFLEMMNTITLETSLRTPHRCNEQMLQTCLDQIGTMYDYNVLPRFSLCMLTCTYSLSNVSFAFLQAGHHCSSSQHVYMHSRSALCSKIGVASVAIFPSLFKCPCLHAATCSWTTLLHRKNLP